MFGLEEQKKKKGGPEFLFELEKELKDSRKKKELQGRVENRITKIKETLRTGESSEGYDKMGVMLHGYTAVAKVMARFK